MNDNELIEWAEQLYEHGGADLRWAMGGKDWENLVATAARIRELSAEVERVNRAYAYELDNGVKLAAEVERLRDREHSLKLALREEVAWKELATAEVERLRATMAAAVEELDAEHRPQWAATAGPGYTEHPVPGKEPVGCVMCYPHDGSWPCVTRMVANGLRAALGSDDA